MGVITYKRMAQSTIIRRQFINLFNSNETYHKLFTNEQMNQ